MKITSLYVFLIILVFPLFWNSSFAEIPLEDTPSWEWDSSIGERAVGAVAWGDVDGDGDLDLAVGCYDGSNWYPPIDEFHNMLFLNNDGVLETTPSWVSTSERHTGDMAFIDVNGDGYQDLICGNGGFSFHRTCIYYGSSSGLSNTPDWNGESSVWTTWVFCGDVNKDGWVDLIQGNQGVDPDPYKPTYIYYNNNGTFSSSHSWQTDSDFIASGLYLGDVDNSGKQTVNDYSIPTDGTTKLFYLPERPLMSIDGVYINDSPYYDYCYELEQGWLSLGTAPGSGDTLTLDYSYTNEPDLAIGKWVNFETGIYFHNGTDINNTAGWTTTLDDGDRCVQFAYVNNDQDQDLMVGGTSSDNPCHLYLNDGGYYDTTIDWENEDDFIGTQELTMADVDGDGDMDLAVVNWSNGETRIYENVDGTLNTLPDWVYDHNGTSGAIAWGDMNGDGALDLAIGVSRDPAMVFLNTSTFDVKTTYFETFSLEDAICLKWEVFATEGENISGFNLYRREMGQTEDTLSTPGGEDSYPRTDEHLDDGWSQINSALITGSNPYTYVDDAVDRGVTYRYRLEAVVDEEPQNIGNTTGVCGLPLSFEMTSIHPNPATDEVNITLSTPESVEVKIEVYDIKGRLVKSKVIGEIEEGERTEVLEVSDLSSGVYTLKAIMGVETSTKKMVVVR